MLSFRFKALIDNNFNNSTQSQQTLNNFYSVELHLRQIRLLLCYCCVCNNLITNDKGGYELRSKYFKGCTSKDITSIKRNNDHCLLLEGFMDYLSLLTIKKLQNSPVDVIVLNSLTNLAKEKNTLASYKSISAFLDNDQAGKRAVQELESICKDVIDQSFLYSKYKDLNEYLCHKQQIQHQDLKKKSGLKP